MTGRRIIRIRVPHVKLGMVLGTDVFSKSGAVLLTRDTIMTEYAIAKLRAWQVEHIDVIMGKNGREPERKPLHRSTKEDGAFFDMYIQSIGSIGTLFEEMRTSNKIPVKQFQSIAEGILDQVLGVQGVLSRLRQVKSGDEYTFNHSLNVGIYSVLIGTWLHYDTGVLRMLATAGLLHDAGKAKISPHIIKKAGPLSPAEFREIKRHPYYGYQMVANTPGMPQRVAMAVLQHHERENGTGYPLKLSSGIIDPLAKILAVADVYDAVTSDRCYQAKRTPYTAANIIMEESFKTLDPVIGHKFLECITPYFFTDKIRLNNGLEGRIVQVNQLRPTRPLIQTARGFIDLDKTPELQIVDVIQ